MNPGNVLVIDDERIIREGCRMVLMERGLSVDVCETGTQGLAAAREGRYEVILVDLKLPDIDGMEILKTLKREKPGVCLIVITGYSTVQNAVEAMKLGAFDYIAKPFSDDELILGVERAFEKRQLMAENLALRKQLTGRFGFANIVGECPKMLEIFNKVRKVAPTDCTVLIKGENGTGKELIAQAIHVESKRVGRQFVAVDCNTLTPSLLESELFGHVKGAFTGALQDKPGIFELAHGGTLFLDDVANLSPDTQGKLLRVLETHEYKPVGASLFKRTDVRLISATNCDLQVMVAKESFREDLYYRLGVFPICLPPLRERKDDIPRLAYHFLKHFTGKIGKAIDGFTEEALEVLVNYEWPGNVRQLKNVVEHLVIMVDQQVVDALHLAENLPIKGLPKEKTIPRTRQELMAVKKRILEKTFDELERPFLIRALEASNWSITLAAQSVGMKRSNFSALMKRYRIAMDPTQPRQRKGMSAQPDLTFHS